MSLTAKIVLWLVLGTFALTAHAHELSEGTGIVCDTPDQVQRFAVLGAKPEAIKTINDGAAKAVCALTTVRYIRGREVSRVRSSDHAYQVVEILLIEVQVHGQWGAITPEVQYTLFPLHEERASLPDITVVADNGQWELTDPKIKEWFRELKMPDVPNLSCCGFSDAYYADITYTKNGKNYAVITDDRNDAPLQRPHVPMRTEIEIPNHKYKWDRGNPTGHNIIFLSNVGNNGQRDVYCFVTGTGI